MANIENVKQGLKQHKERKCRDENGILCTYLDSGVCFNKLMDDAMSVIEKQEQEIKQFRQEQEALEPVVFGNGKTFEEASTWWYGCQVCQNPVDTTDNFCRKCGRAIDWSIKKEWKE